MSAGFTPIPGWPAYAASRDGVIYSVGTNWRGYGVRPLKQDADRFGYLSVRLTGDGRRTKFKVHRLIAETFHGSRPSDAHQVRHLDGNQLNDHADNLDEHLRQRSYWMRFDDRDLNAAANDIILAMDGKIARADALLCARAAFESKGMEKRA